MEIIAAYIVGAIGGYLLVSYFLLVGAITARTKKGKWIGFSVFVIFLVTPVIGEAIDLIQDIRHKHKLKETFPSEELVKEAFSEIEHEFVQLPLDFYSYQNGVLTIKMDTLEDEFISYARTRYRDLLEEMGKENVEQIDEFMVDDVFYRHLFRVTHLYETVSERTAAPRQINVEQYYNNEIILTKTSTNTGFQGHDYQTLEQLYERLKPEIIQE